MTTVEEIIQARARGEMSSLEAIDAMIETMAEANVPRRTDERASEST